LKNYTLHLKKRKKKGSKNVGKKISASLLSPELLLGQINPSFVRPLKFLGRSSIAVLLVRCVSGPPQEEVAHGDVGRRKECWKKKKK
jgi:hypothetical protein